ncbi:hypothetical protein D3C87_916490 [compost metagenome]
MRLRFDLAKGCRGVDARVELPGHQKHHVGRNLIDQGVGQIDHRFLDVRLRQSHDLLARRHHLPSFGVPRGDHGFMVGTQFGIAELVLALIDRRPCLVQRGLGGFQVCGGDVQLCLRPYATIKQRLLTAGIGLGIDQLRLNSGQVALGRTQLVLLIRRIEGGEQRALLHFGSDIDVAAGDAATDAETGVAFITRLDAAGETPEAFLAQRLNFDR